MTIAATLRPMAAAEAKAKSKIHIGLSFLGPELDPQVLSRRGQALTPILVVRSKEILSHQR
jgi:hypothetical protein